MERNGGCWSENKDEKHDEDGSKMNNCNTSMHNAIHSHIILATNNEQL